MPETYKIGIDVGGTFTDLFLGTSEGGEVEVAKTLSTPEDPSVGVLEGLGLLAKSRGLDLETFAGRVKTIVHGTTVTTNATLTRNGALTGLITTRGVRDALEMRRGIREERYDNRFLNVPPLVPRRRRIGVGGRLDYRGREIEALDPDEVRAAAQNLGTAGVEAVAVCFLNAFASPMHERRALDIVRKELPNAYVCASTDILPVVRFYNRVSTTVLNAYVGPVLGAYLEKLTAKLEGLGFDGVLLIMQSNGGVALPDVIAAQPATTVLSGPAAGPEAAAAYTRSLGETDAILFDMGGTSFDASVVRNGKAALDPEGEIDRLRIALPMLDIATIGAGGGSIGWLDEGGLLRMGPSSAGAFPGPACYGRGGTRPTCTDADLVLGYLDPAYFAGGRMPLDLDRARGVIEEAIARPLGLDVDEAAAGMYRVINNNMAHGVRGITVKRGVDPREFALVVAGGAGGIHACAIALELDIATLLVPPTSSVLCAVGMVLSDLQHDFVRTYISAFGELDYGHLEDLVMDMIEEGDHQLAAEGVARDHRRHEVALDLRYLKQYHEVTLPVTREAIRDARAATIAHAFHAEHDRLYGYELENEGTDLELINVRVRSIGEVETPSFPSVPTGSDDPSPALKGRRAVYVPERHDFVEAPVYAAVELRADNRIPGPALIERADTTIFISESYLASIDEVGCCRLDFVSEEDR